MNELQRHVAVILFADISGYTAMMQDNEALALEKLKKFEETLEEEASQGNGKIIKRYGDGSLLLFDSAVHAARCAIRIQEKLRQAPAVPLRIGIHIGEVIRKGHDIFGDGVNIASRIESMSIPNAILISSIVYQQLKNRAEFQLTPLGEFEFKNVDREISLYAIVNEGLAVPSSGKLSGKGRAIKKDRSVISALAKPLLIGITAIVLIVMGWQLFKDNNSVANQSITPDIKRIAVLPLINLNHNDQLDYFSDGVTQEIIDELAKVSKFNLSAFSSTVLYKNSDKSMPDIAEELDVNLILTGSARIFEDSVRLSIELIDPFSNDRLWNHGYDELFSNAFRIQGNIARQVVDQLNIELSPSERTELSKVNTTNPEAFDLVLKARAAYSDLTSEGFEEATSYLEKAIQLDPDYSEAYTLLAWVYILAGMADVMPEAGPANITVDRALPLIERAMKQDPGNSDNYLVRGALDLYFLNDPEGASYNVKKALEINSWPKVPTRYCICAVISTYTATGRLEEAARFVATSKQIDPLNVFVYSDEGVVNLLLGDHDEAISAFEQALANMDSPYFRHYLGWGYYHLGDYNNALKYLSDAIDEEENPLGATIAYLSITYHQLGNNDKSDHFRKILIDRQLQGTPNQIIPLAMVAAGRGEHKKAIELLEMAYDEQEFGFAWYLNVEPVFESLRDEPSFISLLQQPAFKVD